MTSLLGGNFKGLNPLSDSIFGSPFWFLGGFCYDTAVAKKPSSMLNLKCDGTV